MNRPSDRQFSAYGAGVEEEMIAELRPDREVWVPKLVGFDVGPDGELLADTAYLDREAADSHHWVTMGPLDEDEEHVEVVKMTVGEFLRDYPWKGMNPFWDFGRMGFMERWREIHDEGGET